MLTLFQGSFPQVLIEKRSSVSTSGTSAIKYQRQVGINEKLIEGKNCGSVFSILNARNKNFY